MDPSSAYCVDPLDDSPQACPNMTVANFTIAGQTYTKPLENPCDDDYPEHVMKTHSHIDPDHQGPCSESLEASRKRKRSRIPSSLSDDLQPDGSPSKSKKRTRHHKKKEARKKALAETATPVVHSQSEAVGDPAALHRLQVDDPVLVPLGPAHRVVLDPLAPPYLQYFHGNEPSYATTLCRDTAHWSTTHQDDIFIPTSVPLRVLLSDLHPPTSPHSKHRQIQLVDPPRKLVVLDLNGSLLWRTSRTRAGPRLAFRRPYVSVLAQYLAHERTTQTMVTFPDQPGRHAVPLIWYADEEAHFGKEGVGREKEVTVLAPLDAMIWSSARPRNVEDMVDVAFGSFQVALRAVWTRSMIGLSQEEYHRKTQTTKDLRRIWWDTKEAYTVETTVLVDDSPLKARLQPHNNLLIPEYIHKSQHEIEMSPDRTLLAMIGILEEVRSQVNIPAWIRDRGLWGANRPPDATAALAVTEGVDMNEATLPATREDTEGEAEDAKSDMSLSSTYAASELAAVAQQWWEDEEVMQHWVERATIVLNEMSIPVAPGILDPREDTELAELRLRRRRG